MAEGGKESLETTAAFEARAMWGVMAGKKLGGKEAGGGVLTI